MKNSLRSPCSQLVFVLLVLSIWVGLLRADGQRASDPAYTVDQIATLQTLERLSPPAGDSAPLYRMTCVGDYGFDEYMEGGSPTPRQLEEFLNLRFPLKLERGSSTGESDDCSAFLARNGRDQVIFARNLDLPGYHPGLLLLTRPTKGYASLSLVDLNGLGFGLTPECDRLPADRAAQARLLTAPFMPRDGVNEHGLAVASLNVPRLKLALDPSKPTLGRWQVNRLLLDRAKTVDEALKLLEKYNVSANGATGVHFFVADAQGNSAVIEFTDGMKVIRASQPGQVVTNFYLSTADRKGTGQDRFALAMRKLAETRGRLEEEGALELLKEISQRQTAWSVVYNLADGSAGVAMARAYSATFKVPPIRLSAE